MFDIIFSHNSTIKSHMGGISILILYSCILGFDVVQDYVEQMVILKNDTKKVPKHVLQIQGNMF